MPESTSPADLVTFRDRFPTLPAVTHFASCSQGALSIDVRQRLADMQDDLMANPAPWGRWMELAEQLRNRMAARLGASPAQIALAPNASVAAYQVRANLPAFRQQPRAAIVSSGLEFPSIGHVWRAPEDGIPVRSVAAEQALDPAAWQQAIDDNTAMVSVPLAGYANGTRPPVRAIAEAAHAAGAKVFVDAYQGAGVVPCNVDELDCDFLVVGALKYLLGLPGIAFLYARDPSALESPALTGWFGRGNPFAFDAETVDYPNTAARFETGTVGVPSVYAALGGLDALDTVDETAGWRQLQRRAEHLTGELRAMGERVDRPTDPDLAGPQVALVEQDPDALAGWLLTERKISTAPRGSRLRVSLHYYSDDSDIDRLLSAVRDYRRHTGQRE
ncbi:selenocysteine lyase/cysteine desulfurase [Tamaricihabitans halophyticus]|uniref:Selenocysteine lyase/cysteine desulfurase n=1 Tax=Tamaricihabitans halophyticus TaxID=1262583 RepID=A0A4R2QA04_9PSEU|nr:aminotransferase class V-fold PLP-dependent enzyme [Tamaricihabitans halophyticus]TCP45763.1 selenocysteine lyase/cysteine desulfurase [Tamaricihabitans halophyticus]